MDWQGYGIRILDIQKKKVLFNQDSQRLLAADLKKILQGNRFGSNEEVIAKTEV